MLNLIFNFTSVACFQPNANITSYERHLYCFIGMVLGDNQPNY